MILDLVAVLWLDLSVAGVAVATVVAQGVSACISFGVLVWRLRDFTEVDEAQKRVGSGKVQKTMEGVVVHPRTEEDDTHRTTRKPRTNAALFDKGMLFRGTRIAIPTILQQSIVSIGMLLVQSVVNDFGSAALAGYSAASRIESISLVPMIATGNAVATFTAQNIGAGRKERVVYGHVAGCIIVVGFAAVIATVISLFHEPIIMAFLGSDSSVEALAVGTGYLSFTAWFTVLLGWKTCTDAVLRGSGDVLVFTLANLTNLVIRVAAAFILAPIIGVRAIWYVVPVGWLANFLISFIRYRMGRWKEKSVIQKA